MIKAVLLDLDNTLLHNPDHQFAHAFLDAFDKHFKAELEINNLSQSFRRAIKALSRDRDWKTTNTQVILDNLASGTKSTTEQVHLSLQNFYSTHYSDLQQHTSIVDSSKNLLDSLFEQNMVVAIATNPLYPQEAVLDRLEWAGIGEYIDNFVFITHSDNMHFAKPHPAYYAELIARIGIEPDEALMVGDSVKNDINPSQQLGIHTFHVNNLNTLRNFSEHVHLSNWQHHYTRQPLTTQMIVPQYEGNLAALYGLLSQVQDNQWEQRPIPSEWSILQILSHLQISEQDVQRQRILKILDQDNPFLIAPAPPGPNIQPCHNNGYEIANQFRRERLKTIELIQNLTQDQWQRPARHNIFGMTTLLEMAHFTAQHDRLHITQLCQTLGRCH